MVDKLVITIFSIIILAVILRNAPGFNSLAHSLANGEINTVQAVEGL